MELLGAVSRIYRYPVKSFQGELLTETEISLNGMPGDRTHVFMDQSRNNI